MITKDQLELLRRSLEEKKKLDLTIGGTVENAVHDRAFKDRAKQYSKGVRKFREASIQLKKQARANFKSQSKQKGQRVPKQVPDSDKVIAQKTWDQNSLNFHEGKFKSSQDKFRSAVKQSFRPKSRAR